MADNTLLNSGTGGDTIASDDIGGIKFQRVKAIFGSDGVNEGDVNRQNPFPVQIATPTAVLAAVASVQSIAAGTTGLTLCATLTTRAGASICNESVARLYVKYGQGASTTLYSFKIGPFGYWEMPPNGFSGAITGVWDVATGSACTTQWSY